MGMYLGFPGHYGTADMIAMLAMLGTASIGRPQSATYTRDLKPSGYTREPAGASSDAEGRPQRAVPVRLQQEVQEVLRAMSDRIGTSVHNLRTEEVRHYYLPARKALVNAFAQSHGDHNWWSYEERGYANAIVEGKRTLSLGDWCALKDGS